MVFVEMTHEKVTKKIKKDAHGMSVSEGHQAVTKDNSLAPESPAEGEIKAEIFVYQIFSSKMTLKNDFGETLSNIEKTIKPVDVI